MNEKLQAQIEQALLDNEARIDSDKLTETDKNFIKDQLRKATYRLVELCQEIRAMAYVETEWYKHRPVIGVMDNMMAEGQALTHFLWLGNLRDKITDKLEMAYGLSFSALAKHFVWCNKQDKSEVFVMFNMEGHPNVTLGKDGEYLIMPREEFLKDYEKKVYAPATT